MPRNSYIPSVLRSAALAAVLVALAASGAFAEGLISKIPSVHVAVTGVTSEAQLIQQLQALGYSDVKVTPLSPNTADPHPELSHRVDDVEAEFTPVHFGWNGTAVKDGETANVYVDVPAALLKRGKR